MKKALSLICAIAMVASVLLGAVPALAEAPVTLQVIVPSNVQDFPEGITENDNFIVDYWEQATGYDFNVIVLGSENERDQLNVMFNSGEVQGIVVTRDVPRIGTFAAQGLLANLDEYKDASALYNMFPDQQIAGMYDGSQYAYVIPEAIANAAYRGIWYTNKGKMAELGFDKAPATKEEFDALMAAAKDAGLLGLAVCGDGTNSPANGSNDSTFGLLQGLYGLGGGEYALDENGDVFYKYITEDAKAYLEYVKKLYDDGIIPSDFASLKEDGVTELLLSGRALTASSIAMWSGPSIMEQAATLQQDLKFTDYPADVNGARAWGNMNVGFGAVALAFMVSENCPNKEAAMKAIDMMCTPEAVKLANYGIEGTHYTLSEDGAITPIEGAEKIDWCVYFRNVFLPEDWYPVYGVGSNWAEFYYPAERPTVGCTNPDPVVHLPVNSEYAATLKELRDNIVGPFYTKVVMGEESIDNWGQMVESWKAQGGDEILKYYTELFKECGSPTFEYVSYLPAEHPEYTGKYLFNGADDLATQISAK